MLRVRQIALAACGAAVAACASTPRGPAPVEHRRAQGEAAPAPGGGPVAAPSGSVSAQSLPPAGGQAGRRAAGPAVILPERPPSVVIQPGDTLFSLTERYMVSLDALTEANNLSAPYTLYVGQRLTIPSWPTYTVRPGDTVGEIALAANVDMPSLMLLNDIPDPDRLRVGQMLILPESPGGGLESPASAPAPTRPAARPGPGAEQPPAAPSSAVSSTANATGTPGRYQWPIRGEIISTFGPKSAGQRNDGVNIRAVAGEPVRAAADGEVVYAGNELAGYGDMLFIKHTDGWITVYAHNRRLLVGEGARVVKGQAVAEAGSTGSVTSPQLHFEVRNGAAETVDPMRYLPPA